jgi:hypothetical protein
MSAIRHCPVQRNIDAIAFVHIVVNGEDMEDRLNCFAMVEVVRSIK